MLYSPKWEQKTDPLSLESLVAWLEKQPANKAYKVVEPRHCLLGQFARAVGVAEHDIENKSVQLQFIRPFGDIALTGKCTFGAALDRARAALEGK